MDQPVHNQRISDLLLVMMRKRLEVGKSNRSQLPYNHTSGSRLFPITMAAMVAKNEDLDFPKFCEDSHTSKQTNDWIHPKCGELHVSM
ncbi:hypothetical protein CsSME_00024458 [Camellia sinensis var. sinensis]